MIEIDGSTGEGGGQIIRTALALSAVTGKECRIFNIRRGRQNPGLQTQHLEGANAVAALCNAEIRGNKIGSTELKFYPRKIESKKIDISIPTAGSVGLVLQPLMIAASHAESKVEIEINGGATNGKWAPPLNYIKYVLLPLLEKMGYKANIEIKKYGYYPKGGAHVMATINPVHIKPIDLIQRGEIVEIKGISHASKHLEKAKVAERQAKTAEEIIKKELQIAPRISVNYVDALNPGSAIELFATCENSVLGADELGEIKKSAEQVGKEAAEKLIEELKTNACVDEHAEDQLLPFMALAAQGGESMIKVHHLTNHTRTNIWVIEKFLPMKFEIDEKEKVIRCRKLT